ncbi:LOW QUALITY PROTEIN: hypothetical protein HID58_074008, partial [Brassica napus]
FSHAMRLRCRRRLRSRVSMRFRGWDVGRLRDGLERVFPDLHPDNGFGKQRNGNGDLQREDRTRFMGFNGDSGLLGPGRSFWIGWGFPQRNHRYLRIDDWKARIWFLILIRINEMFEDFSDEFQDLSEDVLIENAEEDNQIGYKEAKGPVTLEMDKEQGARMMLFKSQNQVQGLVSPRKRPSSKAGIRQGDGFKKVEETVPQTLNRAHQNPDFMDRPFEEEKLWWQILREQMSRGYYRWVRSVCLVIRRYMEKLKYWSSVEENILLLASLSHKCPNGEWEFNCGVSLVTINYQRKDRECRGYGVNNQTQGWRERYWSLDDFASISSLHINAAKSS